MASASESELRQRLIAEYDAQDNEPSFDDLPYSGKVYMARKKKPEPLYVRVLEVNIPSVPSVLHRRHEM